MNDKDVRWRQRFENFEKSYQLLKKYSSNKVETELERAGIIQFFEVTFELAWKVMKDYLESHGFIVKSPRDTIKQAYQFELINDGHIWLDALVKRNLTTHTYDEELVKKLVETIIQVYLLEFTNLYEKLIKE